MVQHFLLALLGLHEMEGYHTLTMPTRVGLLHLCQKPLQFREILKPDAIVRRSRLLLLRQNQSGSGQGVGDVTVALNRAEADVLKPTSVLG